MNRLSAGDWAKAALEALAEGGPAAVAVEPIAVRLGTTKGSFYWHFRNRRALVEAALELWEQDTERMIAALDGVGDPALRMRTLLENAMADPVDSAISFRLISAADDPAIAEVVRRVSKRRLEFMQTALEEMGTPSDVARRRIVVGYGSYLGMAALRRIGASDEPLTDFIDQVMAEIALPPS
ncbi:MULTISPECIES: TetR/AcrR family transcriptional regulator [Actinomadura]|uniref:TetR/AcrR family transcriptional regulator n=1 Tax=Actinomadura yumaensis TaxID=111807 RepID=A0ABW2D226_9ACTN|nr:TetR/AcrR family transcriptional regulator [Actinomadura sp. J1-007]